MLANDYQSALDWLFTQFPSYQLIGSKAYKPTLENIRRICALIGDPQDRLRFIHIAGTNGKGSCSSMTASILTESGYKVGLFTSPHIADFRERIRVNGEKISEAEVLDFVDRIRKLDLEFEPSFFEITFAMALDHFTKTGCEICVIETGLGGRLDATNIIHPLGCLITNISLEHTAILGHTVEEIASEKAGIIKEAVPVIIGETTPGTRPVFERFAKQQNAPLFFAEEELGQEKLDSFKLPLLGTYQQKNLRSVLCLMDKLKSHLTGVNEETIQKGLDAIHKNTGFFGRMQVMQREPLIIFDVSHNEAGIRSTLDSVKELCSGKLYILYGSSSDKDVSSIVHLFPPGAEIHFTGFHSQRSLTPEDLDKLKTIHFPDATVHHEAHAALGEIKRKATREDTILVFGSFFLISELLK